jgi:hypothetical protein
MQELYAFAPAIAQAEHGCAKRIEPEALLLEHRKPVVALSQIHRLVTQVFISIKRGQIPDF